MTIETLLGGAILAITTGLLIRFALGLYMAQGGILQKAIAALCIFSVFAVAIFAAASQTVSSLAFISAAAVSQLLLFSLVAPRAAYAYAAIRKNRKGPRSRPQE